jgi:heterodisulfide reductase subunit D
MRIIWNERIGLRPSRHVPAHLLQKDRAEVVYFVGCVASFFPMVQSIPVNMVRIMDRANVDFAILGGEEWCCGFPLVGSRSARLKWTN